MYSKSEPQRKSLLVRIFSTLIELIGGISVKETETLHSKPLATWDIHDHSSITRRATVSDVTC